MGRTVEVNPTCASSNPSTSCPEVSFAPSRSPWKISTKFPRRQHFARCSIIVQLCCFLGFFTVACKSSEKEKISIESIFHQKREYSQSRKVPSRRKCSHLGNISPGGDTRANSSHAEILYPLWT